LSIPSEFHKDCDHDWKHANPVTDDTTVSSDLILNVFPQKGATPMTESLKNPLLQSHSFDLDVQIFDTDCFGVMWHGAYTKWLEMGRVKLFEAIGVEVSKPGDTDGYIYPVVDQHFRYKSPARFGDTLTLTTTVEAHGHKLVFQQQCHNHTTDKITIEVQTTIVVLDMNWKTQRRLPEVIASRIKSRLCKL
jgi:acyl-CoA thioester hydrolase